MARTEDDKREWTHWSAYNQVILFPLHLGCRTKGGVLPSWPWRRLFLGPGFRLGARWNRLGETVKTRKK